MEAFILISPHSVFRFRTRSLLIHASKFLFLKTREMNLFKFLVYRRSFSVGILSINNNVGMFSHHLRCKLNRFLVLENSLRTGVNWKKSVSSRIIFKSFNKKTLRYRNMQSLELTPRNQTQAKKSLKETRKRVAEKMEKIKENVLTIPNALCIARIASTPVLGYLIIQECYTTSLCFFIFAGITDIADGYIARNYPSQQSMLGSFLDPAADKVLVATLFMTLTIKGLIPVPLTSLIIFRDVCLFAAGFYIRYLSLPPPKTLKRYFNVSLATARLSPTTISKLNTAIQLCLVGASLAAPVFGFIDHRLLETFWYVVGGSTILSAGSYLYCKNTYKLLSAHRKAKKLSKKS